MKKAVIGLGVATGALLIGMSGEASAQQSLECGSVYDETLQGDSSAALRQVIGEYATAGVEVHVQIYEDLTDQGVANNIDAEGFADRLATNCGWSSSNVEVLVSLNPRSYVVHRDGKADRDISQSAVDNAEVSLGNDLRDSLTSFQADTANLLERINPYDQEVASQPAAPRPAVVEAPSQPRDIPVKEIIGGIAGVAAIGAAGARLKRAHSLRQEVSQELKDGNSDEIQANLTSENFSTEEQLSVLPDDDAVELRKYNQEASVELANIIKAREELQAFYKSERKRLWPDMEIAYDRCVALERATDEGQEKLERLKQERAQVETFIAEIDGRVAGFSELLQTADAAIKEIQATGWDLGYYLDTYATFQAAKNEVAELRSQNYIEKPAEIIDGKDDEVMAYVAEIQALPDRREAADKISNEQPVIIEARITTINEANKVLSDLRQQYHQSCSKDIDATDRILAELLKELRDYNELSSRWSGVKTVVGLESAETSNQQFAAVTLKIDTAVAAVHERARSLEEIKSTLPDKVTSAAEELAEARQTAFERYRDDVEDGTRDQINDLEEAFNRYKDDEVTADKPKYLELAETLADYKNQAASLTRQAVTEKDEMDNLRDNINELERQVRTELSSLESYIASYGSDVDSSTESRADSIHLLDGDTTQTRQGLRNQVEDFRRQIADIESVEEKARDDVRREEERREAERRRQQQEEDDRRRRQREEDDRRRDQAAAASAIHNSPSHSPSSGSTDSGSW